MSSTNTNTNTNTNSTDTNTSANYNAITGLAAEYTTAGMAAADIAPAADLSEVVLAVLVRPLGENPVQCPQNEDECLKNTRQLLKKYRSVLWASEVTLERARQMMQFKYGLDLSAKTDLEEALAQVPPGDTQLEGLVRMYEDSSQMLGIYQWALKRLQTYPDGGARLHRILEVTYFRSPKPADRKEALNILAEEGYRMSMSSYHNHLKRAERVMNMLFWECSVSKAKMELLRRCLEWNWDCGNS